MWGIVSKEAWQDKISGLKLPVYYQTDFIESVSETFKIDTLYYVNKIKGEDKAYYVCYNKNGRVYNPEPFSYTPFYIHGDLAEPIFFEIVEGLIKILKANFRTICLKLEPDLKDIRPFLWHNYNIEVKYTRVKNDFSIIHKKRVKSLKKINKENYNIVIKEFSEDGLNLIMNSRKKFGFTKSECDKYSLLFNHLSKKSFVKFFEIYDAVSGKLICSQIVLIDRLIGRIYLLMISDIQSTDKNIHTYMHSIVISWAKENGIKQIDFCGANVKSISVFKSFFGTELQSYYIVSHIHWIYKIAVYIKGTLRKALRMINL